MKKSVYLTLGLTILLLIIMVVLTFTLPAVLSSMEGSYIGATKLLIPLYTSSLPGFIAVFSLLKLLLNILKEKVFVKENVTLLSILSYCCLFVGVVYFFLSRGFISMLLLSFAALFFGLILAVIKNVFKKAVLLREENDYTV